jgi:hypothetical protein
VIVRLVAAAATPAAQSVWLLLMTDTPRCRTLCRAVRQFKNNKGLSACHMLTIARAVQSHDVKFSRPTGYFFLDLIAGGLLSSSDHPSISSRSASPPLALRVLVARIMSRDALSDIELQAKLNSARARSR